jgi:hypothetical protein
LGLKVLTDQEHRPESFTDKAKYMKKYEGKQHVSYNLGKLIQKEMD